MSVEETELTFIRCPSCRSLVPSVAARCRMCGHYFENDSDSSLRESFDSKRKSRVRQRTISINREEVEEFSRQFTSDIAASQSDILDRSDKTSDMLNTEEDFQHVVKEEQTSFMPLAESVVEQEIDTEIQREGSREIIEETVESGGELVEKSTEIPAASEVETSQNEIDAQASFLFDTSSIDRVLEGKEKEVFTPQDLRKEDEREQPEQDRVQSEFIEENISEPLSVTEKDGCAEVIVEESIQQSVSEQEDEVKPIQIFGKEEGFLIGWFVFNLEDNKRESVEIRSGKYFLGQQALRESDLVIPHSSLSSPHCLMAASFSDGVKIQDIMSENGTYLRRSGSDEFIQMKGSFIPMHGDVIKFGSCEAILCLIPKE